MAKPIPTYIIKGCTERLSITRNLAAIQDQKELANY